MTPIELIEAEIERLDKLLNEKEGLDGMFPSFCKINGLKTALNALKPYIKRLEGENEALRIQIKDVEEDFLYVLSGDV